MLARSQKGRVRYPLNKRKPVPLCWLRILLQSYSQAPADGWVDIHDGVDLRMELNLLNGPQRKLVRSAFLDAFDEDSLNDLLVGELDKPRLDVLVAKKPLNYMISDLIELSRREAWTDGLVMAAQRVSSNSHIRDLAAALHIADVEGSTGLLDGSLEATVRRRAGFTDFALWIERFARVRRWVCRIETPSSLGTGFLVADDLVLTNYHVVQDQNVADPFASIIACRFDYSAGPLGVASAGVRHPLTTKGWLVDKSPEDELDYALIRLATDAAGEIVDGSPRGYLPIVLSTPRPQPIDIVFIVQHPEGSPLKLSVGTALAWDAGRMRLRYDANTEPGSSGSPCLDVRLNVVALHCGRDCRHGAARFNEGIPIGLVIEQLQARGFAPTFWG